MSAKAEAVTLLIGVAAVVVSLAAVVVAWTQAEIARAKLRADLFERRAKVFSAHYELISACLGKPGSIQEEMNVALEAKAHSHFLFGSEVETFLTSIHKEVLRIEAQRKLARHPPDVVTLDRMFPTLVATFKPYLQLDDTTWLTRFGARLRGRPPSK